MSKKYTDKNDTGKKRQREGLTVRIQDRDKETEATGYDEGHPLRQRVRGRKEDRMTG